MALLASLFGENRGRVPLDRPPLPGRVPFAVLVVLDFMGRPSRKAFFRQSSSRGGSRTRNGTPAGIGADAAEINMLAEEEGEGNGKGKLY
jgi:hypothetical protein